MKILLKITTLVGLTSVAAFADATSDFVKFKTLAEQGDANAQANIASFYAQGFGTPKNPQKALEWAQKSAAQGDDIGLFNLGYFYVSGIGKKDMEKGVFSLTQAALKNHIDACKLLVSLYTNNQGAALTTPQGAMWAYIWTSVALGVENPNSPKVNTLQSKVKAMKAKVNLPEGPAAAMEADIQRYIKLIKESK